jgi:dTDP-6-deoxy-L-talose 4-dehydrogenase (NAD+)
MSTRILLTGASGFVGRQVLNALLEKDVLIRCVTRLESVQKLPTSDKLDPFVITQDLFQENEDWWRVALQDTDLVVHLAWYAEPGKYQFSPKNIECLIGTLRMGRAATETRVNRFVGIGTCLEYQQSDRRHTIDSSLNPTSPYAACKAAAFMSLSQYFSQSSVDFAWCRLFYLYGEGEDSRRLFPSLHESLSQGRKVDLTSGNQKRDFLDVREASRQIVDVALGDYHGPVNVCSGEAVTVRQFAESIADEYNRRDLLNFGSRMDNPVDPQYVVGVPSLS